MTTLILSGWTQPIDALAQLEAGAILFDYSAHGNADAAIAHMATMNPSRVIGWSMGGQLALRAIMAGVIAPKHLTLIAAPMQFVADSDTSAAVPPPLGGRLGGGLRGHDVADKSTTTQVAPPPQPSPYRGGGKISAMDPTTFRLFRESYASDPARTKTRFHGLVAKGDRDMKRVMGLLGHHPEVENVARWLPWLDDLAAYRLDVTALASAPPTLIIHGMNDAIVPLAQGERLASLLPRAQLNVWAQVGHAPHVHDAARLMAEIAAHRAEHGVQNAA